MENYHIVHKLGSGNFAKVYLAIHEPSGKQVALKLIQKSEIQSNCKNLKMLQRVHREIANMEKLSHPNIVELLESFETSEHHVIAMEYVSNGELFDYVQEKHGLPEDEAKEIFQQIAEAVQHCHKNSVVHRDLKLENILLDRDWQPKLADFGFSKEAHTREMLATYCGSPLYASPEMILGRPYLGPECDIWSLGIILYTMLTATMPFDDRNFSQFTKSVEKGDYPEPDGTSKLARDLISKMLDPTSKTRATINDILTHPWLTTSNARKVSLNIPALTNKKTRKTNVCYSNSEALGIQNKLGELSCDSDCTSKDHSDSSDCEHYEANEPSKMHDISRNSSGYDSAYGSELFTPGRVSQVDGFLVVDPVRKSSHTHRSSFSKSPVPFQIPEIDDFSDEGLVFV